MAKRFGRARQEQNPPIHFPGWDEGEHIQLRPVRTWLIDTAIQEAALGISVDALQEMEGEERTAFVAEHGGAKALTRAMILQMVESHTFTDEDGQPLDMADLVDQFTSEELRFIRGEIDRRDGAVEVPATEVGDFRGASDATDEGDLPAPGASADGAPHSGSKSGTHDRLDTGRRAQSAKRALAAVPGGVERDGGG